MSLAKIDADVVVDARTASSVASRRRSPSASLTARRSPSSTPSARSSPVTRRRRWRRTTLARSSAPTQRAVLPQAPRPIFKRAIRGMLPYKTEDGREALSNVRVYVGNPYERDDGTPRPSFSTAPRSTASRTSNSRRSGTSPSLWENQRHMVTNTSGKKKTAVARATVRDGRRGRVRINSQPVELVEPEQARLKMLEPFRIAGEELRADVDIEVNVGGRRLQRPGRRDADRHRARSRPAPQRRRAARRVHELRPHPAGQRRPPVRTQRRGGPGARARYQKSYR